MLAVEGTDTEEVAELIMLSAESAGSHEASEAAHTSYRSLDPPMVLFQSIIIGITLVTPPAKHFAAEDASVFITGREELGAAVKGIGGKVSGVRADISKLADIDRLYDAVQQKHSQIDVLFTNADGGSMLPLGAITEEQYEDTFGRNVNGVIFTVQKALSLLRDGAAVVLMGSTAGTTGTAAFSIYGASKAAVRNLARSWTRTSRSAASASTSSAPAP